MLMKYHKTYPMHICIGTIPSKIDSNAKVTMQTNFTNLALDPFMTKRVYHSITEHSNKFSMNYQAIKSSNNHLEEL